MAFWAANASRLSGCRRRRATAGGTRRCNALRRVDEPVVGVAREQLVAAKPAVHHLDVLPRELRQQVALQDVLLGLCGVPDHFRVAAQRIAACAPPGARRRASCRMRAKAPGLTGFRHVHRPSIHTSQFPRGGHGCSDRKDRGSSDSAGEEGHHGQSQKAWSATLRADAPRPAAYESVETNEALGALADRAKASADRASAVIDEALELVAASNKRITAWEAKAKRRAAKAGA